MGYGLIFIEDELNKTLEQLQQFIKRICYPCFFGKKRKKELQQFSKGVDIFGKLLKVLTACAYMRAGASVHPLAHPVAHLQLGR
jgi:hypothetical protein